MRMRYLFITPIFKLVQNQRESKGLEMKNFGTRLLSATRFKNFIFPLVKKAEEGFRKLLSSPSPPNAKWQTIDKYQNFLEVKNFWG